MQRPLTRIRQQIGHLLKMLDNKSPSATLNILLLKPHVVTPNKPKTTDGSLFAILDNKSQSVTLNIPLLDPSCSDP